MKARLSINERAELVKRDGTVVGRITAISVDFDADAWGLQGESSGEKETSEKTTPVAPTLDGSDGQLFDAPSPEQQVWQHWLSASGSRQKFDSTRRGIIRNALRLRDVETLCKAIDGLVSDPWWRENRPRLELRYALRGNHAKGESDEDRIEKMVEKAGAVAKATTDAQAKLASLPEAQRHDVVRLMQRVRQALRSPEHAASVEAGRVAAGLLKGQGFEVRLREDGSFGGWEVKQ